MRSARKEKRQAVRRQMLKLVVIEARELVRRYEAGRPVMAARIPWAYEMIRKHG